MNKHNKNTCFHLFVLCTVLMHAMVLLRLDVISFECQNQCENINTNYVSLSNQVQNLEKDKNILVLYDNQYGGLDYMNERIQETLNCDMYSLDKLDSINIKTYDVILLGSTAIDNQPTDVVKNFLKSNDFSNIDIAFYWVGATDYQDYESSLSQYIEDQNILQGIGFNSDEISGVKEVKYLLDEWLETIKL